MFVRASMALFDSGGCLNVPRRTLRGVSRFPAHRVIGNIYYVGSKGLAAYLITTPQGSILINSNLESSLPMIRESVEKRWDSITPRRRFSSSVMRIGIT